MSLFNELKRRNVFRVGFAYAVVGWLVAQVADVALESFGAPDWVMKTLLLLILRGFVLALFIAWVYEMTPQGIRRESQVDRTQSVAQSTGRKLDRIIIGFLALAVIFLLADPFGHDSETIPPALRPHLRQGSLRSACSSATRPGTPNRLDKSLGWPLSNRR